MATRRAIPVPQDIFPRSSFNGGWPLALSGTGAGCPSSAPVVCKQISDTNPQCCPSGLSCGGDSITSYCCPSTADCKTFVETFPACANSTWTMYADSYKYFCCETGQTGVLPPSEFDGLCEAADQVVPSSLLATLATQVAGGSSPTNTAGSVLSATPTLATTISAPQTTLLSGMQSQTLTPTYSGSSSSLSTPVSSPSSSSTPASTSSSLSTGTIIGIVIGGLGLLLLAGIFWALLRRRRPQQPIHDYRGGGFSVEPVPAAAPKPALQVSSTPVYGKGFGRPTQPQYSNAPERYDHLQSEQYNATHSPMINNSSSELENPGHPVVAELRGDRSRE